MTAPHRHPHWTLRAAAATILTGVALAVAGCGGSDTKTQPTPTTATPAQLERSAAAERRLHVDEILGEYISELRDSPAAANDPRATAVTVGQLSTEAATAPPACAKQLAAIVALINRRDAAGPSKSARIKAALVTADLRC